MSDEHRSSAQDQKNFVRTGQFFSFYLELYIKLMQEFDSDQ